MANLVLMFLIVAFTGATICKTTKSGWRGMKRCLHDIGNDWLRV